MGKEASSLNTVRLFYPQNYKETPLKGICACYHSVQSYFITCRQTSWEEKSRLILFVMRAQSGGQSLAPRGAFFLSSTCWAALSKHSEQTGLQQTKQRLRFFLFIPHIFPFYDVARFHFPFGHMFYVLNQRSQLCMRGFIMQATMRPSMPTELYPVWQFYWV